MIRSWLNKVFCKLHAYCTVFIEYYWEKKNHKEEKTHLRYYSIFISTRSLQDEFMLPISYVYNAKNIDDLCITNTWHHKK